MKLYALTSQGTEAMPSTTVYILIAMLALLLIWGIVKLVRRNSAARAEKDDAPAPNPGDAAIAAAIAASIVASEDRALVAAITAAVQVYLETENGGKSSLPTGFRVVSFKRRTEGSWNRK